jgi:glycyl-tRNA synthetase beta chain
MSETRDLLFEIGVEELPASFVEAALRALPELVKKTFAEIRLDHRDVRALGTPRRLAVIVEGLSAMQPDLEEIVTGPPTRAAFKDGQPTRAAEAFAKKVGCAIDELARVDTPKGEYLQGTRHEKGRPASELLGDALTSITKGIPFRKSMRWGDGSFAFGRPIRWFLALFGEEGVDFEIEGIASGRVTYGHRFLHPGEVKVERPSAYVEALRTARVIVAPDERRALMVERLHAAAKEAGGTLIEDDFLVGENLSLVEDPQVVLGGFDESFLALPDVVILEVARGHQRYFGVKNAEGALMPNYLAVVNTAEHPDKIRLGNDRVMRARLADARFFYDEDLKRDLSSRRAELGGIVFQKRLGSVLDKVERMERLVPKLAELGGIDGDTSEIAARGASLCKCDLVTLMVGEFPELQGEIGEAYAKQQGEPDRVGAVIADHYKPKGAKDAPPDTNEAALVAIADRLDTLVGCFAIGLSPTGAADPYALRRACIGTLRILLDRELDISLGAAFAAAHAGFQGVELDLDGPKLQEVLGDFFTDRLRGLLSSDDLGVDVVNAALGVSADRPLDARARARAINTMDPETRSKVGEVFKRATNIAKEAPEGDPKKGDEAAEVALHEAFFAMKSELTALTEKGDYEQAFEKLGSLAPTLGTYFDDVLVMAKDEGVRDNRLRLMRVISETCSGLARLELLGG